MVSLKSVHPFDIYIYLWPTFFHITQRLDKLRHESCSWAGRLGDCSFVGSRTTLVWQNEKPKPIGNKISSFRKDQDQGSFKYQHYRLTFEQALSNFIFVCFSKPFTCLTETISQPKPACVRRSSLANLHDATNFGGKNCRPWGTTRWPPSFGRPFGSCCSSCCHSFQDCSSHHVFSYRCG